MIIIWRRLKNLSLLTQKNEELTQKQLKDCTEYIVTSMIELNQIR